MLERIKSAGWLREANLIGGRWVAADDGRTVAMEDPATGNPIGTIACSGAAETRRAIDAAYVEFESWGMTTAARACRTAASDGAHCARELG